jgi:hypothetical protein
VHSFGVGFSHITMSGWCFALVSKCFGYLLWGACERVGGVASIVYTTDELHTPFLFPLLPLPEDIVVWR